MGGADSDPRYYQPAVRNPIIIESPHPGVGVSQLQLFKHFELGNSKSHER